MPVIYPDFKALGILVCERPGNPPFAEGSFLLKLILTGNRAGLRVFAFDPRSWRPSDGTVMGWTPDENGSDWRCSPHPLPGVVYDRSWPDSREESVHIRQAVSRMESAGKLQYLNSKLPDKWRVYSVLSKYEDLSRLLPPTELYDGPDSLRACLDRNGGAAFLKPASGSQGRRTAACIRGKDGGLRICGRQSDNRPFDLAFDDEQEAAGKLRRWIGTRTYLMQPLLALNGPEGEPFDIRVLLQKNGRGYWAVTGAAARIGSSGTFTANLHGGGSAEPADRRLSALFGTDRSADLMKAVREACRAIVRRLESHFGRFCELGLDFGVDRSGRLWFLEANSKPGRYAMAGISDSAAETAAARPIAYAKSILLRPPGRVIHEFDYL